MDEEDIWEFEDLGIWDWVYWQAFQSSDINAHLL
jgi:hypothetical protein